MKTGTLGKLLFMSGFCMAAIGVLVFLGARGLWNPTEFTQGLGLNLNVPTVLFLLSLLGGSSVSFWMGFQSGYSKVWNSEELVELLVAGRPNEDIDRLVLDYMERNGRSIPFSKAAQDLGYNELELAKSIRRLKEPGKFERLDEGTDEREDANVV